MTGKTVTKPSEWIGIDSEIMPLKLCVKLDENLDYLANKIIDKACAARLAVPNTTCVVSK